MRRIRMTVAYDGTDFHGWQVQAGNLVTIQGTLEAAVAEVTGETVHVAGSGRTDAGVHALAQIAACSLQSAIPPANLQRALNRLLPESIRILDAAAAPDGFHPRFDAVAKTYEYRLFRGELCSPFERRYVHHHPYPCDWERVAETAPLLVGEYDFSLFAASDARDAEGGSKVREIFASTVECVGDRVVYRVRGSGFLKHMVRNIVGMLIQAGRGNIGEAGVRALLRGTAPRKAGPRAPASGLFLAGVEYPPGLGLDDRHDQQARQDQER